MKKLASLLALVLLLAGATPALAGDDRPIAYEKLPAAARQFITAHFADTRLSYAKVDSEWWDTTYEVVFIDGRKVEFARDGSWREVSCKSTPRSRPGLSPRRFATTWPRPTPDRKSYRLSATAAPAR